MGTDSTPKRVLIDGRAFCLEGSSISVYLFHLLQELFKDDRYRFVLAINNPNYLNSFSAFANVEVICLGVRNNIVWDNLVMGYLAYAKRCALLFYPKGSTCWLPLPGKKILVTIHGMVYKTNPASQTFIENLYWRTVGKIASLVADRIVAVSSSDKRDLVSEGYQPEKIEVLPIGINPAFGEAYRDDEVETVMQRFSLERKGYIVHLGHLQKKKNQAFSIDIFSRLLETHPQLKLVLIGRDADQGYCNELRAQIQAGGLQERVVFAGAIDQNRERSTIAILLQHAVFSLFPSVYEGFGMPAVEAIASGIPVLCSDRGAMPEVLGADNVLPLEDKDRWYQRAQILVADDAAREVFLAQQQGVIGPYAWDRIALKYLDLIEDVFGFSESTADR